MESICTASTVHYLFGDRGGGECVSGFPTGKEKTLDYGVCLKHSNPSLSATNHH